MSTIKQMMDSQAAQILERWEACAAKAASARGLTRPELMNIMPLYVASLVQLDGPDLESRQVELVESHMSSRLRHGFDLPELQNEFTLLGRCIFRAWAALPSEERPEAEQVDGILETVHRAVVLLSDLFVRHLLDDAQSEKRIFRLIRQAFTESPSWASGALPSLADRLRAAMPIVMEALEAATVAILLYEPSTEELVMTASAGLADESLTHYVRSLGPRSFAGVIASREETTTVLDAETTELEITETLRHSGIRSLLGVRIPVQRKLVGVMYIGMRVHRPFSGREKRKLEAIAEHLSLLIENARVNVLLEKQIDALRAEQHVREGLASILAHDLRGPLSAARVAAQMLGRTKDEAKAKHWAEVILRSLDRGTRMVSDLLDAERAHAGQRLAISRERCDLTAIARDVVDELSAERGQDRLVIIAPEAPVSGNWGREDLRRAIWNVVTNALKYGSAEAPVRITVKPLPDHVEVEIHNEGPPIPPEEQETLFKPFIRAGAASSTPGGWGIGLAVVRGVAEAHGGTVDVDSAAGRGTSFTMRIPFDG